MVSFRRFSSAALLASLLGLGCVPFRGMPPHDGGPDGDAASSSDLAQSGLPDVQADQVQRGEAPDEPASDLTDAPHTSDAGTTDSAQDAVGDTAPSDGSIPDASSSDASGPESSTDGPLTLPQPPKTGLVVQLEADYGIVATADGLITKWRDESGNGFDATTDVGFQPPFIADDVNAGGGAVVLGIDPGDSLYLPTGFSDLQGGVSAFFVFHLNKITGVTLLLGMSPNGPLLNVTSDADMDLVSFAYHVGTGGTSAGRAFGFPYGTWHLVEVVQGDGPVGGTSSFTVFLDGTALVTDKQPVPSTEPKTPEIGPVVDQGLLLLQAALIYSRPVSNDERGQIESYLMKKWGIE